MVDGILIERAKSESPGYQLEVFGWQAPRGVEPMTPGAVYAELGPPFWDALFRQLDARRVATEVHSVDGDELEHLELAGTLETGGLIEPYYDKHLAAKHDLWVVLPMDRLPDIGLQALGRLASLASDRPDIRKAVLRAAADAERE